MNGSAARRSSPEAVPVIASKDDLARELRRVLREAEAREGGVIGRAGLAKRLSISKSSLYAYLNGTTLIPGDALSALLRGLDVDGQQVLRLRRAWDRLVGPVIPPEPVLPLDLLSFSVISGPGGVGKTTLAVRWAHRRLSRFPDGCLYLDLRGFHPDSPLDPSEALATLLRRLGVPGTSVPLGLEERRERYLRLLSGKRMLILLDNAFSADHVRHLLPPGTSGCFVLVTSRDRLSGLVVGSGAHPLPVGTLPDADARALLAARLGDARVSAEPEAVAAIVASCLGLPLALSAVAGRALSDPGTELATLAAELSDARTRSRLLDDGDARTAVGTVFSWSLASLTAVQVRAFALLGIAPGPDIAVPAAASLLDLPLNETRAVLDELVRVSLIHEAGPGRYRMHDVVRHYAAEAAQRDLDSAARNLGVFHSRRGLCHDRLAVWQAVLDTPGRFPDVVFDIYTHRAYGRALSEAERFEEALVHLKRALDLGEQHEDLLQQASTHLIITGVFFRTEEFGQALDHAGRARILFRELGNPVGEAHSLGGLAWASALCRLGGSHAALGHVVQARVAWRAALDAYREIGRDKDVRRVQRKLDGFDCRSKT